MFKRINILSIVKDHFGTLTRLDSKSKRIYWKDLALFIGLPAILGVWLACKGFSIKPFVGNLIAAVAIFGGFLFNLLAIIYSQIDKIRDDANNEQNELKKVFVKEIHINISYSIVLSLLIIIVLIGCTTELPEFQFDWLVKKITLGLTYFLLGKFLLTLLMVLNRVYILLKKDSE
jgi:hypothetical protein